MALFPKNVFSYGVAWFESKWGMVRWEAMHGSGGPWDGRQPSLRTGEVFCTLYVHRQLLFRNGGWVAEQHPYP